MMKVTVEELRAFINAFADLLNLKSQNGSKTFDLREVPAAEPTLEKGFKGLYLFTYNDEILTYQPIIGQANRVLLNDVGTSLLEEEKFKMLRNRNSLNDSNVCEWIKQNCKRIDLISHAEIFRMLFLIGVAIKIRYMDQ